MKRISDVTYDEYESCEQSESESCDVFEFITNQKGWKLLMELDYE